MAETPDRIESLFAAAVGLSAQARAHYLEQACADDAAQHDRLLALLRAHDRAGHLLDRPANVNQQVTATTVPVSEQIGAVIAGRYKLLEQIGEGGMGTVWVAEQTEPVKRRVALKLIKPGMDTRQVLSRFDAERQALALMDHPNIARVFDGGMTAEGRPFFVMEYVKGLPLTQYSDEARLSVPERLALFTQVCQAVQHAHQKGIIHRDLKPSNILICLYDGQPVPKVIDFGLAKAMHQSLTDHTLYTAHGLMVGTPLYMSPEQAEFNNLDIDTRSDVYSLGVILYELLTGTTPLEKRQLRDAAWQEMVRLIKEEEPPRPSIRLSGSGSLPALAAQRQLEPAKLAKAVRGELDWIVMKALEKDRNRRYETANGMARDVQRYLADESVEACPPSASYRLQKFARRNQRALTVTAVVAVALLVAVGAVAGSVGWTVRDQEARRTKLASQLEVMLNEVNQQVATKKWPEALAAAQRAEALLIVGGGDIDDLNRQFQGVLADLKLVERLEEIRMEQSAHMDNLYEWAEQAYAAAFLQIGVDVNRMSTDEAAHHIQMHKRVTTVLAESLDQWSVWRVLSGNDAGARALSAVAGRIDPDPWRQRMRASGDEIKFIEGSDRATSVDPKSIESLVRMAESPDLAGQPPTVFYNLGMALSQGAGNHKLGTEVLRRGHLQYPGDFWINTGLNWSLRHQGPEYQEEAIGFGRAALALRPTVGWSWMRAGEVYQYHYKRLDEANACYMKAIELDPDNAWIHNNVAWGLYGQRKLDQAADYYRIAIKLDPKVGAAYSNLGNILREQKRLDEAIASHRQAIEVNPRRALSQHGLGLALLDHHLATSNEKILEEAVAALQKAAELAPRNVGFWSALAGAFERQKEPGEAIASYRKAIEVNPKEASLHTRLGVALGEQGSVSEALASFRKAVELNPKAAWAHGNLALYLAAGPQPNLRDPNLALIHAQMALELLPENPVIWRNLGIALLRAGKTKAAVEALQKVDEISKGTVHIHRFFLAEVYWQNGEQDKARQAYEQAAQWMDQNHPNDDAQRRFRADAAELLGIAQAAVAKAQ